MTSKHHRNNRLHNKEDNKIHNSKPRPKQQDPKVPQEVQSLEGSNDFNKKKAELADETQNYMYSQSSKFSSVSRNLIFGIMGTIWAFTFTKGEMTLSNLWLVGALVLCIVYFMLDVIHYYTDTNSYNKEQYRLDSYKNEQDLQEHERIMDRINKCSNIFIKWKFRTLILITILFLIGVAYQVNLFSYILKIINAFIKANS